MRRISWSHPALSTTCWISLLCLTAWNLVLFQEGTPRASVFLPASRQTQLVSSAPLHIMAGCRCWLLQGHRSHLKPATSRQNSHSPTPMQMWVSCWQCRHFGLTHMALMDSPGPAFLQLAGRLSRLSCLDVTSIAGSSRPLLTTAVSEARLPRTPACSSVETAFRAPHLCWSLQSSTLVSKGSRLSCLQSYSLI